MTFPANGTLFLDVDGPGGAAPVNLATVGAGVFVGVADINAGHLYFQPDADELATAMPASPSRCRTMAGSPMAASIWIRRRTRSSINIEPDNLAPVVDLNGAGGGINYTTTFVEDGAGGRDRHRRHRLRSGCGPLGDLIESATITLTDRVAGDSLTLTGALPPGFTAITTNLRPARSRSRSPAPGPARNIRR